MKTALVLGTLVVCCLAMPARADFTCEEELFLINIECFDYFCIPYFELVEVCTYTEPGPPPDPYVPPPPPPPPPPGGPYPPSVTIASVDTTDPQYPVAVTYVGAQPGSGMLYIEFMMNGSQVGGAVGGAGRYQFGMYPIGAYGDGNVGLSAQVCDSWNECGSAYAQMQRFTPSALETSTNLTATWQEPDEEGPMTHQAAYNNVWRQTYTQTTFTVPEVGENSRRQVGDALVTLSADSAAFEPYWSVWITTSGTLSDTSHTGQDSGNPYNCAQACWSKWASGGEFGYMPSLSETIANVAIRGYGAFVTGGQQSMTLP